LKNLEDITAAKRRKKHSGHRSDASGGLRPLALQIYATVSRKEALCIKIFGGKKIFPELPLTGDLI
jgi:hypothetical protein